MKHLRPKITTRGFTLAELLMVIVIISILAGVVVFATPWVIGESRKTAAKAQILELGKAVDSYHAKIGDYPAKLEDLVTKPSSVPDSKWPEGGFWPRSTLPKDPWGNEYIYVRPGVKNKNSYDIMSYGRDGQDGGTGDDADIGNFDEQ
jgi:general secretion pathway protein G